MRCVREGRFVTRTSWPRQRRPPPGQRRPACGRRRTRCARWGGGRTPPRTRTPAAVGDDPN
eukprot:6250440-Pyramimonas_sp.AAC.1